MWTGRVLEWCRGPGRGVWGLGGRVVSLVCGGEADSAYYYATHVTRRAHRTPRARTQLTEGEAFGARSRYIPDPSLKRQIPRASSYRFAKFGDLGIPGQRAQPFAQPFECPSARLVVSGEPSRAPTAQISTKYENRLVVESPLIEDVFVCCTRFLRMYFHRVPSRHWPSPLTHQDAARITQGLLLTSSRMAKSQKKPPAGYRRGCAIAIAIMGRRRSLSSCRGQGSIESSNPRNNVSTLSSEHLYSQARVPREAALPERQTACSCGEGEVFTRQVSTSRFKFTRQPLQLGDYPSPPLDLT